MDDLYMMRAEINWAAAHRWMADRRIEDRDRAMHCLTKETFGPEATPKPYWYETPERSAVTQMLAYTNMEADDLIKRARENQTWPLTGILNPDKIQTRAMDLRPEEGDRFRFAVRTVPVIRKQEQEGRHYDMDVALTREGEGETRAEAYCKWFASLLERQGGAEAMPDLLTLAEPHSVKRLKRSSRSKSVLVTEVNIEGALEVKNPDRFRQLVKEGIGRQRSYGNGMMRLRPA